MSDRRRQAREQLEIYLVHLILAWRYPLQACGLLLLAYSAVLLSTDLQAGFPILLPAIFLLLLGNSFHVALYMAKLAAWIGTIWRSDD